MNKLKYTTILLFFIVNMQAQMKVNATGIFTTTCKAPNTGKIELNVTGAVAPVTFLWQDGNIISKRENLRASTYSVTITDAKNQLITAQYEIKGQTPITINPELEWSCYGQNEEEGGSVLITLPNALNNEIYPIASYNVHKPPNAGAWLDAHCEEKDSMYFTLSVTDFQYNIVVDARQCSLVFNPPIPKWDVSNFRVETTPSIDNYYYDLGEEFNFKASISIPKDSIKSFGWTTRISTTKVDSCKQCLNYKSIPNSIANTAFLFYAIDVHNCERLVSMRIYPKPPPEIPIIPPNTNHYLPNTFSPNDDGINDYLTVYGAKDVDKITFMRIFDHWGNLIFEQKDFPPNDETFGWNGAYKQVAANQGTYTCTYEVLLKDKTLKKYTLPVQLVR